MSEAPSPAPPPTGDGFAARLQWPRLHWGWWLLLALFMALAWASRSVVGPFIAGLIIAYLLDPPARRLERWGWPRWAASAVVLLGFVLALAGLAAASAPIVEAQIQQLVTALPGIAERLEPVARDLLARTTGSTDAHAVIANVTNRAFGWATASASTLVAGSLAFVNVITFVVISPIVAFYLLRDWPALTAQVNSWWPRRHVAVIEALLGDANRVLSGFIRGQFLVCVALALLYAIGWSLVGLDYALVLALLTGFLGFVPFIGPLFALGMSLVVGLGQWGLDPLHLGLVAVVFAVNQGLESSVLTPNLIGERIGLHPVWVLLAVFAGGAVAGLAGVFLAVPVAAVIGVVVRFAFGRYRQSRLYRDEGGA